MVAAMFTDVRQAKVRQIRTVWAYLETFFKDHGINSKNTEIAYRKATRDFFSYICGKSLEQLTIDDLHCDVTDVRDYRIFLREERNMAVGSVNVKMAAIKQVMLYLAKHDEFNFINVEAFAVKKMKGDADSYGELSFDEAMTFVQRVKSQEKGAEKSLLFELATFTSIRRDALLSLEWKNFEVRDDMVIVTTLDKGKKEDRKPIDIDLYNRLLALKRDGESKVFSLTRKTANRAVRTVCDQLGIPDERNIVLHSFKKTAINWILRNEGDVVKAARQGNHSDLNTMYKHYAKMKEDFSGMAGMNMGKEIDMGALSSMTAEQLLVVIARASNGTKAELLRLAKG